MAHTVDAVVYGPGGILWMIVIPDDDSQLDFASYNPPGGVQLRMPLLSAIAAGPTPMDMTTAAIARARALGVTLQLAPAAAAVGNLTAGS
jgi:hypothetical protein